MFGPFGWTKGVPHKHELTKFYPKLELRRALLIYIYIYITKTFYKILVLIHTSAWSYRVGHPVGPTI